MTDTAFDVNASAWDPQRDSANERLSLLGELDAVPVAHARDLLDPMRRTMNGKPLGARRAELLLGCTFNDLETFVNRVNAMADYDDDEEVRELRELTEQLGSLLGRHRVLKIDSDDVSIERMPVAERRNARGLQLRIDAARLRRYDPVTIRRRHASAAIPALQAAIARAEREQDRTETQRLERLLARSQHELERLASYAEAGAGSP